MSLAEQAHEPLTFEQVTKIVNPFEKTRRTLTQIFDEPDPEWDVVKFLKPWDLGFIVGKRGSGKTLILHHLLGMLAQGSGLFAGRFEVRRPLRVLYVSNEGRYAFKPRLRAVVNDLQLTEDEVGRIEIQTAMPDMFRTNADRSLDAFIEYCQGFVPDLIAFDTLANLSVGGNENDQKDAGLVVSGIKRLQEALDGARVVALHHEARGGNFRGSTVFEGAADWILGVTPEETDPTKGVMSCLKMKDAEHFHALSYRLNIDPQNDSLCTVSWEGLASSKNRPQGIKSICMRRIAEAVTDQAFDRATSLPIGKIIEAATPGIEADLGEGHCPKRPTIHDYVKEMTARGTYGIETVELAKADPDNKANANAVHYFISRHEE